MSVNASGLLASIQKANKESENGHKPKVGETKKEVTAEVVTGNVERIVIPHSMTKLDAAAQLYKQYEDEETETRVAHEFIGWDFKDSLVAIMRTMHRVLGYSPGVARETFFGKILPMEINVPVGFVNGAMQYESCFFGQFEVAQWDGGKGQVMSDMNGDAVIVFTIKKKFGDRARQFFAAVNEELLKRSIYKGKSVVVKTEADPDTGNDKMVFEFIENLGAPHIILNAAEERTLKELVINPLGKTGKRCILFTGGYGTGKTETAMRVGKEATDRGITFMYCKSGENFTDLLDKAKRYSPALIFLEDIDEIGSGEERDSSMNEILNQLDGVQTKGNPLTVIFTTNNERRINSGLRRPGRIDIVLRFNKCDKPTISAIYERMLGDLNGAGELDYRMLADNTPHVQGAIVAEISKRARDIVAFNDRQVSNEIVLAAITSIMDHIEFMEDRPENIVDMRVQAIDTIAAAVADKVHSN
jgi:hypothetical protein